MSKLKMNQINGLPTDSFEYSYEKFKSIYTNKPILTFVPLILIIDFFFVSSLTILPSAGLLYFFWFVLKSIAGPDWFGSNNVAEISFLRKKKADKEFKTKEYDELKEIYDFNSKDGTDKELQIKINKYDIFNYLINFVIYGLITMFWFYIPFYIGFISCLFLFVIFCNLL